ncbi:MAG: hypothetical protein K2Q01_01945 [Rickettsiales bacterium]|nr:hypothetical protein [Rickettsiales bacterium]
MATDEPPKPLHGLQVVSSVTREQLPAILAVASSDELARHCNPRALQNAYIKAAGLEDTLELMQKARWRRVVANSPGSATALHTSDPDVIAAYGNGRIKKLIDTLIEPAKQDDSAQGVTIIGMVDKEFGIGGRFAVDWLSRNGVNANITPTRR